jgi:signal transduction histidine kinase
MLSRSFAQEKSASEYFKNLHPTDWKIGCVYSLPNGIVLCGTEGGMLMHDGFKFTEVPLDRYEAVNYIFKISTDKLLLIRENTLVELEISTWKFNILYKGTKYKNEMFFAAIQVDESIFIGSSVGLQKWNIPTKKMFYLTAHIPTKVRNGIATRSRSLSYNKRENEVLFGIKSGVFSYKTLGNKAIYHNTDTQYKCVLSVKSKKKQYVVNNSSKLFIKQTSGKLVPVPLSSYFDTGYRIYNFLEYQDKLLISSYRNGTLILDLKSDSFIKNDPVFGPISEIRAVCQNNKYNNLVIATLSGLITIAKPPNTFSVIKDSLPNPIYACHALYYPKNNSYFYVSNTQLIEFKIGQPGYNAYEMSNYFTELKNITLDFYGDNELVIYGRFSHVYFDLNKKEIYQKNIFRSDLEAKLNQELIIDTYTSVDKKLTMFSTMGIGLFVKDDLRDTQYIFEGGKLGGFNTICKIHPISKTEFLMGANGFGGVYYLNIENFDLKYFPPEVFDKFSVSKIYVRNIFEFENRIYFTGANTIWEFDKEKKEIIFSKKLSQIREGVIFYQNCGDKVFLTSKHHIYVMDKNGLSLMHNSNNLQSFAFLIPYKNSVAVFSGHKMHSVNLGNQFKPIEINVSQVTFENRIKLCDEKTEQLICKYDDPLLNMAFFVNYPLFNDFNGKIYYRINDSKNWQVLQGNSLNFSGLKPGKYTINYYAKLKAERSAVHFFSLIIQPPWYLHPIFWAIVILLLIAITIIMVRRKFKLVKQKKLKEIELVLNSLEAERARFSKDLHDGVSPNLSALKMILNNADLDPSKFIINPEKLIDTTLSEIKEILHNITPETLKQSGLAATISSYITNSPFESIKINFNSTLLGMRYSEAIEINIYRMFQELFNNAIKYANCKEINIELFVIENKICLMVSDDGKGFDIHKLQTGFGIKNINSRVELLHGTVSFDSSTQSGTTTIIKVPLDEKV